MKPIIFVFSRFPSLIKVMGDGPLMATRFHNVLKNNISEEVIVGFPYPPLLVSTTKSSSKRQIKKDYLREYGKLGDIIINGLSFDDSAVDLSDWHHLMSIVGVRLLSDMQNRTYLLKYKRNLVIEFE